MREWAGERESKVKIYKGREGGREERRKEEIEGKEVRKERESIEGVGRRENERSRFTSRGRETKKGRILDSPDQPLAFSKFPALFSLSVLYEVLQQNQTEK